MSSGGFVMSLYGPCMCLDGSGGGSGMCFDGSGAAPA